MMKKPTSGSLVFGCVLLLAAAGCENGADSAPIAPQDVAPKTSGDTQSNVPPLARGTIASGDIEFSAVEELRSQMVADDDHVRANAVERLGQVKDVDSMPKMIDAMDDASPDVRQSAYVALRRITNLGVPFDAHGSAEDRATAIAFYRDFWEEHKDPNGPFMQVSKNPSLKYTKYGQKGKAKD